MGIDRLSWGVPSPSSGGARVTPMADPGKHPSRITHGALLVLACLHEADASSREVFQRTSLSESTTYRWVTELADAGVLDTYDRTDSTRDVVVYHLTDNELGEAAQVVVDHLGRDKDQPTAPDA